MPVSKAQQKAVNKYRRNNYDLIQITVPKGKKTDIQAKAAARSQSVNAFIVNAIDAAMQGGEPDATSQAATAPAGAAQAAGGISIPPDTLQTAHEAANRAGETVLAFVSRSIKEQDKRDAASLRLGIRPTGAESSSRQMAGEAGAHDD